MRTYVSVQMSAVVMPQCDLTSMKSYVMALIFNSLQYVATVLNRALYPEVYAPFSTELPFTLKKAVLNDAI